MSCKCCKKIISSGVSKTYGCSDCIDVCTNPMCGDPELLTIFAPVVYDEIGINLCRTVDIPNLLTTYPNAAYASTEVIDLTFTASGTPETTTSITQISNRPNCYEINLTNLRLSFRLSIFDCCDRLLGAIPLTAVSYLPPDTAAPGYDEDTNPTAVGLEIFAPYGVAYTDGTITTPEINFVGFSSTNNQLVQGLNMIAIPKILDFDVAAQTATIGITFILKSIYFTQYMLPHKGKAIVSKGSINSTEDSICREFVNGSLLDRNIKPLEIYNPLDNKENCVKPDVTPCQDLSSNEKLNPI